MSHMSVEKSYEHHIVGPHLEVPIQYGGYFRPLPDPPINSCWRRGIFKLYTINVDSETFHYDRSLHMLGNEEFTRLKPATTLAYQFFKRTEDVLIRIYHAPVATDRSGQPVLESRFQPSEADRVTFRIALREIFTNEYRIVSLPQLDRGEDEVISSTTTLVCDQTGRRIIHTGLGRRLLDYVFSESWYRLSEPTRDTVLTGIAVRLISEFASAVWLKRNLDQHRRLGRSTTWATFREPALSVEETNGLPLNLGTAVQQALFGAVIGFPASKRCPSAYDLRTVRVLPRRLRFHVTGSRGLDVAVADGFDLQGQKLKLSPSTIRQLFNTHTWRFPTGHAIESVESDKFPTLRLWFVTKERMAPLSLPAAPVPEHFSSQRPHGNLQWQPRPHPQVRLRNQEPGHQSSSHHSSRNGSTSNFRKHAVVFQRLDRAPQLIPWRELDSYVPIINVMDVPVYDNGLGYADGPSTSTSTLPTTKTDTNETLELALLPTPLAFRKEMHTDRQGVAKSKHIIAPRARSALHQKVQ